MLKVKFLITFKNVFSSTSSVFWSFLHEEQRDVVYMWSQYENYSSFKPHVKSCKHILWKNVCTDTDKQTLTQMHPDDKIPV